MPLVAYRLTRVPASFTSGSPQRGLFITSKVLSSRVPVIDKPKNRWNFSMANVVLWLPVSVGEM